VGDIDQFGVGVAANYSLHRGGYGEPKSEASVIMSDQRSG